MFRRSLAITAAILGLATLALWLPLAAGPATTLNLDWLWFDAFTQVARHTVLTGLPPHDPWICGGLDLLANPQHRMFSPLFLLNLILPSSYSQWIALWILTAFGLWGVVRIQTFLGRSLPTAFLTGFAFVSSSWFAMHWSAGHIAFSTLLLLPWFFLWAVEGLSLRRLWKLGGLLILCAWDGGNYTVVFGGYTALSGWWVASQRDGNAAFKALFNSPAKRRGLFLLAAMTGAGLLAKILPSLAIGTANIHHFVHDPMNWKTILHSFFNPLQTFDDPSPRVNIAYHEMSAYLGLGFSVVVLFSAHWRRRDPRLQTAWRESRALWILFGFWFWTATGWLWPLNPWAIHVLIPGLHVVHSENRLLLLMVLNFVLAVGPLLDALRARLQHPWAWAFVLVLCGLDVAAVTQHIHAGRLRSGVRPAVDGTFVSTTITSTLPTEEKLVHYFKNPNTGTIDCYEPSWLHRNTRATSDTDYRGEAYALAGTGRVRILQYVPGRLRFEYELEAPGEIEFNTNHLLGWDSETQDMKVTSRSVTDRLRVGVPSIRGTGELRYRAWTWHYQMVLALAALALWIWGLRRENAT